MSVGRVEAMKDSKVIVGTGSQKNAFLIFKKKVQKSFTEEEGVKKETEKSEGTEQLKLNDGL